MPDTGAPWNIPFLDGTELVRAYPDFSEDLADAVAAGLSNIPVLAGIGSNVVSAAKTNVFSTASTSYVDVDDLEVTITPTSATSKILVIADITGSTSNTASAVALLQLLRNGTPIHRGDAGNRASGSFSGRVMNLNVSYTAAWHVVDTPETTSPVTYKVQVRTPNGTAFVNRATTGSAANTASTITAIEVSG